MVIHILSYQHNLSNVSFVMFFSNEDGLTVTLKNIVNINSVLRENLEAAASLDNCLVRFLPFSHLRRDLPLFLISLFSCNYLLNIQITGQVCFWSLLVSPSYKNLYQWAQHLRAIF